MKNSVKQIAFQHNQIIDTLHPDECFTVSYMGRANITTEKAEADEGGGNFVSVEIVDLWIGVEVPSVWYSHHFRKVAIPDGSPRFKDLTNELETAAIDQFYSPVPLALPDEIKSPILFSELTSRIPPTPLGATPLENFFCG